MSITRTPTVEPGTDFEAHVPITKAFVDSATGERHIQGVASGVAEDRDGERVSKNGVLGMIRDVSAGGVKLTGAHQQDWLTECGDVVKAVYDAETDEMMVDTVLPPEGTDPIADKAWRTANKERVGFSVGGKLLKSFFERNELGKKRKVLDAIKLRHIMLTKSPSYPHSFAEAVAKTWDGEPPADEDFTLEGDVEKAETTGSYVSGDSDGAGGRESVGSGQRNAGTKKPGSKGMSTEDPDEEQDDKDLPEAKDQERHLACPNCGHEFAADLPVDPEEQQLDDKTRDEDKDQDDTGKSLTQETTMPSLTKTVDDLRALADAEVPQTDPEATEVAKTETTGEDGLSPIEKIVAASYQASEQRIESLEGKLGEAFELVAKTLKGIQEQVADLPQGRKSVAHIRQPTVGHGEGGEVAKSVEDQVAETDSPVDAIKLLNEATYGIK